MKLTDCEIAHRHLRGNTAVVIVGARSLSGEELGGLAADYLASYGATHRPVYFSGDGWQLLPDPAVEPDAPIASPEPAATFKVAAKQPRVKA